MSELYCRDLSLLKYASYSGWDSLLKFEFLHGDISLANIIVASDNKYHFLIDLGLSLFKGDESRLPSVSVSHRELSLKQVLSNATGYTRIHFDSTFGSLSIRQIQRR